jgi:tetratricopeptide (TPR) repeat protein
MALQAALHHPLAQIARELNRLVAAREAAALRALLRGEGTPSFSRDGDEPGELCWLAIRRFVQPRKPWLDELAALTAALVSEVADAMGTNAARQPAAGGTSASGNGADPEDAAPESYVFNLFLFASYQPASPVLFDELGRFRFDGLELPILVSSRAAAQLQTAVHRQQTDARFARVWIDELTAVCSSESLGMSARAEALSLWQALLWTPAAAEDDELNRSYLLRALAALAGENADTPAPERVNMLQTALDELEVLYQHSSDFWRRFFRTDDDHLALWPWVWELIEDRWPDEQSPELSLQGETRDFWRMLPIAVRVRLRALAARPDPDWNEEFFNLLSSRPAVPFLDDLTWKKQVTALKASLDKAGGRNAKLKIVEREAKQARTSIIETGRPRRQESAVLSLERVTRTLAAIERELTHGRDWKAREFFDDLLEREQMHGTPDDLIAKTVSSAATLAARYDDLQWAEALWSQARFLAPHDPVAASGLADTLKAQERYAEAETLYRQTMTSHPNDAVAANGLAETLKAQERYAEAEALYRQTMTSHPNDAVAASGLADTLKAQERYAEAETLYRATLAVHRADPIALHALANLLRIQGRAAEAVAVLDTTRTRNPRQLRYVAHLKAVIIAGDDPQRALALLESSLHTCRTARDRDRFHATIAAVQLRLKRYEDAGNSARELAVDAPAAAKVVQLHAFRAAGNEADAAEVRAWLATQTLLARIQSAVSKVDLLFSTVVNRDQAERELISEELDLLVTS